MSRSEARLPASLGGGTLSGDCALMLPGPRSVGALSPMGASMATSPCGSLSERETKPCHRAARTSRRQPDDAPSLLRQARP
jgi:hypothetical protein